MDRRWMVVAMATALWFSGCAGARAPLADPNAARDVAPAPQAAKASPEDAAALFARVEETLLALPELHTVAELNAEGALQASLEAKLKVSKETSELSLAGSFGGQPVRTELVASGDKLQIAKGRPLTRPAALHDALVLGLTRMGLMHNAARLTGSGIPDHADGGVRTWVETKEHVLGADTERDGKPARAISFAIFIDEKRAAEATLWVDPATLLPLERTQVVHFPQGDMRVTERYRYEQ